MFAHFCNHCQIVRTHELGIGRNRGQFLQQLLQVFFVGLTIGMQRTVVPVLAESEFGLASDSTLLMMAFVVSFGFVKGGMNFVSGRLSEHFGRRLVLIWGWCIALPIPFIFLYAPSWNWIVGDQQDGHRSGRSTGSRDWLQRIRRVRRCCSGRRDDELSCRRF